MSNKAEGYWISAPQKPVKAYSELLESYFECLHRLQCQLIQIPKSIEFIPLTFKIVSQYYYASRDLLEDDYGISKSVSDALQLPDISGTLKTLICWEDSQQGEREFLARLPNAWPNPYSSGRECWMNYRLTLFEVQRILTITRQRGSIERTNSPPRHYPWLSETLLKFED